MKRFAGMLLALMLLSSSCAKGAPEVTEEKDPYEIYLLYDTLDWGMAKDSVDEVLDDPVWEEEIGDTLYILHYNRVVAAREKDFTINAVLFGFSPEDELFYVCYQVAKMNASPTYDEEVNTRYEEIRAYFDGLYGAGEEDLIPWWDTEKEEAYQAEDGGWDKEKEKADVTKCAFWVYGDVTTSLVYLNRTIYVRHQNTAFSDVVTLLEMPM